MFQVVRTLTRRKNLSSLLLVLFFASILILKDFGRPHQDVLLSEKNHDGVKMVQQNKT